MSHRGFGISTQTNLARTYSRTIDKQHPAAALYIPTRISEAPSSFFLVHSVSLSQATVQAASPEAKLPGPRFTKCASGATTSSCGPRVWIHWSQSTEQTHTRTRIYTTRMCIHPVHICVHTIHARIHTTHSGHTPHTSIHTSHT
ncbi:hypothetical protein CF336_g6846 [Tilletia laevis]|nr:hypothetical protein CF336_g6846 [Tilletia laevis]